MEEQYIPEEFVDTLLEKFPCLAAVFVGNPIEVFRDWEFRCPKGHWAMMIETSYKHGGYSYNIICPTCGRFIAV